MRARRTVVFLCVVACLAGAFHGIGSASEGGATVTRTSPYDGAAVCSEGVCDLNDSGPAASLARSGVLTVGASVGFGFDVPCWVGCCIGPLCGGSLGVSVPVPGPDETYTLIEIVPPVSGRLFVSALVSGSHSFVCMLLRSSPSQDDVGAQLVAPTCRAPLGTATLFSVVDAAAGSPVWAWIGINGGLPVGALSVSYSMA